jgi:hypothetical protein
MFVLRYQRAISLLAFSWLLAPASVAAGGQHYTVSVDQDLEFLDVRACFEGTVPRRLAAGGDDAARLLRDVRLHTPEDTVAVQPRYSSLKLPRTAAPACVHYRVDLQAVGTKHWRSQNWRLTDAVIIDPVMWLWLPEDTRPNEGWRLDFELPPGHDVSAPWKRTGRTGQTVSFEVRERMPGYDARVAIGRFSVESIDLAGGRVRYALLPGEPAADAQFLRHWVTGGLRALVSAYGRLPVPELQLLVVPVGQGDEAVPWGEVQRGGGDAVHLYIDQRVSEEAFMDDWVLVHELGHLLHPVIDSDDRWLSEGIASYYQNVLRARAGLKSPAEAWNRLHAGFERGIRGTPRGRSLAEVSETMMRDRSFMRVYWSGAAIALLADVELRRRSDGTQSLDSALAAFGDCCLPADRRWNGREFMRELDRITGTTVFMELYDQHVDSDEVPALATVYTDLGLERINRTRLNMNPTAEDAAICAAIMAAPEN